MSALAAIIVSFYGGNPHCNRDHTQRATSRRLAFVAGRGSLSGRYQRPRRTASSGLNLVHGLQRQMAILNGLASEARRGWG